MISKGNNIYRTKQVHLEKITEVLKAATLEVPNAEKLLPIPGVGFITVAGFSPEVGDIRRFDLPKQIQKLAGLELKENSSGKHHGRSSISKRGRKRLRKILFQVILPHFLEVFFYGYKSTPTAADLDLPKTIFDEERPQGMLRYGKLADTYMMKLQKQNPSELDFYSQFWKFISENPVLPNKRARIIALLKCAIDKRLPYYQLDRNRVLFHG